MTAAERQRRHRAEVRRSRPDPKTVAKQQRRAEREAALAAATRRAAEMLGAVLYAVLYVDPPWDFLVYSRVTGMDRHAANHYPVMSLDALAALKLPAAKDCILFLWVPLGQMRNAIRMVEDHWGFTFKTARGWGKDGRGTGYIVIENLEMLLIFSRGDPVWPALGTQPLALDETGPIEISDEPWRIYSPS
jgi:hypothetical protein